MTESKTQNSQKTPPKGEKDEAKNQTLEKSSTSRTANAKNQQINEESVKVKIQNNGTGSIDYGGAGRPISFDLASGDATEIQVTRKQLEGMKENFKRYRQLTITEI